MPLRLRTLTQTLWLHQATLHDYVCTVQDSIAASLPLTLQPEYQDKTVMHGLLLNFCKVAAIVALLHVWTVNSPAISLLVAKELS